MQNSEKQGENAMLIAIIGENCSGKSTLADAVSAALGAEVVTGRD